MADLWSHWVYIQSIVRAISSGISQPKYGHIDDTCQSHTEPSFVVKCFYKCFYNVSKQIMNGASQNTIKISGKQMINIYRDVLLGYIYEDDLLSITDECGKNGVVLIRLPFWHDQYFYPSSIKKQRDKHSYIYSLLFHKTLDKVRYTLNNFEKGNPLNAQITFK